jgi:rubrerythrin
MPKKNAGKSTGQGDGSGNGKGNRGARKLRAGVQNLLYQVLETELGGVEVYTQAIRCAKNPELKQEWEHYLDQTIRHVDIARNLLEQLGLDPDADSPARDPVRRIGEALVETMTRANEGGDKESAEIVAAECVVLAETKDHLDWELVGVLAEHFRGADADALKAAFEQVEVEEDRHLYHNAGWARELWIQALGFEAVLPPPEEQKNVESAIEAAYAKEGREESVG